MCISQPPASHLQLEEWLSFSWLEVWHLTVFIHFGAIHFITWIHWLKQPHQPSHPLWVITVVSIMVSLAWKYGLIRAIHLLNRSLSQALQIVFIIIHNNPDNNTQIPGGLYIPLLQCMCIVLKFLLCLCTNIEIFQSSAVLRRPKTNITNIIRCTI